MNPLRRNSLADQAAALLRQAIAEGRWKAEMPSEAELCRELQISRVTLRRALEQLVRSGWISLGGRGAHHRIRKRAEKRRAISGRVVRLLTPFSTYCLGSIRAVIIEHVAERLGSIGCRLEYEHRPGLFTRHLPEELKRICSLPDTAAWLLFYPTEAMEHWFAESGIPCMAFSRLRPDVEMPSVYPKMAPVGRHAAGLFYRRGHRELVYMIAELTSLNDRLTAAAFAEEAQRLGARCRIITHGADADSMCRKLDALHASQPRPTAFFSACPEHCMTILCYLFKAGLRVPEDASIIAGWDDEFLQFAVPKFACYRINAEKTGRKVAAILMDLVRRGTGNLSNVPIEPEFLPGETLGSTR